MNDADSNILQDFERARKYFCSTKVKKIGLWPSKAAYSTLFRVFSMRPGRPLFCGNTFNGKPFHGISGCAISRGVAGCGLFEVELTKFLINELGEGDVFVDIGCHLGYYSMLAAELVGSRGVVLAIDPQEAIGEQRVKNISHLTNVRFISAAVGRERGSATLKTFGGGLEAFATLANPRLDYAPNEDKETIVKIISLDEIIDDQNIIPSHIKIDAEGSELEILKGAKSLLGDIAPLVVCEVGDIGENSAGSTLKIINEMFYFGYKGYSISSEGLVPIGQDDYYPDPLNLVFKK